MISNNANSLTSDSTIMTELPQEEAAAQHLLKRTPGSYLLNQLYGLWFFASTFLLTVIITHEVTTREYGIYAVAMTAYNTIQYIVALGLEDATTTFVPRVLAEHGKAAAALLIRRLLLLRIGILIVSAFLIIYGLPALTILMQHIQMHQALNVGDLFDPEWEPYILPIALLVVSSGVANLLNAVCAALMRMKIVFVIGSLTQIGLLGLGFVVLQSGGGINGLLWLMATGYIFVTAAYVLWLSRVIFARGAEYRQPLKPVLQLGISAWLTNLASGALLKQVSIILLGYFAVSLVEIGYFNLSFQLADAANYLLVAGFGGVGGAALAAAFVGKNYQRLARSWQALIKVETILAATGLVFCLFNAPAIAHALYGSQYDPMGPLFAIFLFFNILVRIIGTTIHQLSLYVVGESSRVALAQWIGISIALLGGIVLIPHSGPAGALIADGIAKTVVGLLMLFMIVRHLPRRYPMELLGFTLRFLLALVLAALPGLLWHPTDKVQLVISGCIFLVLSLGLLLWIKPLSAGDMEMLQSVNPRLLRYLRWFARPA
ncbi:MAG: hypothetical protein IMW89_19240 [Ktedonobacteraceae bacterium]|nr:hypothetical protein [Ktedonobacteraceae bacterium]